jgi:hypothetical protein
LALAFGIAVAALIWPTADGVAADFDVPGDAPTIQAAINLSRDSLDASSTIHVATGTYFENLVVANGSKSLTISANDGAKVVVRAANNSAALVDVQSTLTLQRLILATLGRGVVINTATANLSSLVMTGASTAIDCVGTTSGSAIEQVTFFQVTNGINCPNSAITIRNNIFSNLSGVPISPFTVSGITLPRFNLFFAIQSTTAGERGTNEVQPEPGDDLNPDFVDSDNNDFHLRQGSAAIDKGEGGADVGAYGGTTTHTKPFPPGEPSVTCGNPDNTSCEVSWPKNHDNAVTGYLVLSSSPSAPDPGYGRTDAVLIADPACTGPSDPDRCLITLGSLVDPGTAPSVPATPTARFGESRVRLTWPEVAGATTYDVYKTDSPTDPVAYDRTVSVPEATVDGLANGTTYRFAVLAVRQPRLYAAVRAVYDAVSPTATAVSEIAESAAPGSYGTASPSALSGEVSATPQPVVEFPPLDDAGGCFIATAAYGSPLAPQVDVLRTFRERFLRPYAPGRLVIRMYETLSPPIAAVVRSSDAARLVARIILWPVAGFAWIAVKAPWWGLLIAGGVASGTWLIMTMRRGVTRA